MLPDYFFEVAASSTGKYHPKISLGPGGLVRHTKAAVRILNDLLALEYNQKRFGRQQVDCMIASLILHDGWKHGMKYAKFTVADHPVVVANWIRDTAELRGMLDDKQFDVVYRCVSRHMGQWNTDFRSKKEIMDKPEREDEFIVHLADYLASRKYLQFDFGDDYYDPSNADKEDAENLKAAVGSIIAVCKEKVSAKPDIREKLYEIIAENNNGHKNPNCIQDLVAANKILELVKAEE